MRELYEQIRKDLFIVLCNIRVLPEGVPVVTAAPNIACLFCAETDAGSKIITNEFMDACGVSLGELNRDAVISAAARDMVKIMEKTLDGEIVSLQITGETKDYASSAILYPKFLELAGKGKSLYLMMYSINEFTAVIDNGNIDYRTYQENLVDKMETLPPEERLSDKVLYYDAGTKAIVYASVHDEQGGKR